MPYLHIPPLQIGPFSIHAFGVIAALAVLLGAKAMRFRALELGLDTHLLQRLLPWLLVGVVLGAHVVSVTLYYPDRIMEDPLIWFRLWDGLSSFGGIVGGLLVAFLFFRRLGLRMKHYKQVLLFGAVVSLLVGRFGCAVTHDHPGKLSDSPLAVKGWPTPDTPKRSLGFYTEGEHRHDLGLYEFLYLIPLTGLLYLLRNILPFENFHLVLVMLLYAPIRFALDFLRAFEPRYFGFTPGQFFSAGLFILGIGLACHGLCHLERSSPIKTPT